MKIKTALANIEAEVRAHNTRMQTLYTELDEALEVAINKERASLIKKFAKSFDQPPELVEKKILPKAKRQCDKEKIEEMRIMHENQAIMYKPIIINDRQYFYQDKDGGVIVDKTDDNRVIIVGFMMNNQPNMLIV